MKKLAIILGFCMVASFLAVTCPAYTKRGDYCTYTGSIRSWTEWPFGIKTEQEYKKSKLEQFIELKYPGDLKHHWVYVSGTGFDIFGRAMIFACGRPGPLYYAHSHLGTWCELTTDQEKKDLYDVLVRGDKDATQHAIDGMWKRIEDRY